MTGVKIILLLNSFKLMLLNEINCCEIVSILKQTAITSYFPFKILVAMIRPRKISQTMSYWQISHFHLIFIYVVVGFFLFLLRLFVQFSI